MKCVLFLQTTSGREARAENAGLKEEVQKLQSDMNLAARQLEAERAQGKPKFSSHTIMYSID